jgi:hypothetical protein
MEEKIGLKDLMMMMIHPRGDGATEAQKIGDPFNTLIYPVV